MSSNGVNAKIKVELHTTRNNAFKLKPCHPHLHGNPRRVWEAATEGLFLDFILVSSSRCPHLFYIQILGRGQKNLGCLINKTVGLLLSILCGACHRGFLCLSSQPRWCADIWILMGVFLWLPCARCFGVEELAEQFVPRGTRVKHAKVKVWSSVPIVPNMPYYLFKVSECRNSFSFCSEKPACEDASSKCERSSGLNNKKLWECQSLFTSQIKTVCLITAATDCLRF